MSRIDPPDNRPAVAWVLSLPHTWTTPRERLLLFVLALDSYDGISCKPTREALLKATGLWADGYYEVLTSLTAPNEVRPALLHVRSRKGARTVFTLLSTSSGNPDQVADHNVVGESRLPSEGEPSRGIPTTLPSDSSDQPGRGTWSGNVVGEPSRGTSSGNPDYHPSLPSPTLREGREGEALTPPSADAPVGPRLTADEVRAILTEIVPEVAQTGLDCSNPDLSDAIGSALASGWDIDSMRVALSGMKAAKRSATGQAIKRLQGLAERNPSSVILTEPEPQGSAATRKGKEARSAHGSDGVVKTLVNLFGSDVEADEAASIVDSWRQAGLNVACNDKRTSLAVTWRETVAGREMGFLVQAAQTPDDKRPYVRAQYKGLTCVEDGGYPYDPTLADLCEAIDRAVSLRSVELSEAGVQNEASA